MGSAIEVRCRQTSIAFRVHIVSLPSLNRSLFSGRPRDTRISHRFDRSGNETLPFNWTSDGGNHWLRAEVRDANGSLMLISNPIYIHPATH